MVAVVRDNYQDQKVTMNTTPNIPKALSGSSWFMRQHSLRYATLVHSTTVCQLAFVCCSSYVANKMSFVLYCGTCRSRRRRCRNRRLFVVIVS